MKQIYLVKSYGYRDPVAFADKESADAVADMAGGTVDAVRVIDVDAPWLDDCSEGGEDDGRA